MLTYLIHKDYNIVSVNIKTTYIENIKYIYL